MEASIKYHKSNDSSDKCTGKRQDERQVLNLLMQEGKEYRQSVRAMRELISEQNKKEADKEKGQAGNEWLGSK